RAAPRNGQTQADLARTSPRRRTKRKASCGGFLDSRNPRDKSLLRAATEVNRPIRGRVAVTDDKNTEPRLIERAKHHVVTHEADSSRANTKKTIERLQIGNNRSARRIGMRRQPMDIGPATIVPPRLP